MILILLNKNYNKNESKEHYELKQIAKYILYSKSYNCIATEVSLGKYSQYLKDMEDELNELKEYYEILKEKS